MVTSPCANGHAHGEVTFMNRAAGGVFAVCLQQNTRQSGETSPCVWCQAHSEHGLFAVSFQPGTQRTWTRRRVFFGRHTTKWQDFAVSLMLQHMAIGRYAVCKPSPSAVRRVPGKHTAKISPCATTFGTWRSRIRHYPWPPCGIRRESRTANSSPWVFFSSPCAWGTWRISCFR